MEDAFSFKICLSGRTGVVQVWNFTPDRNLSNIFSVQVPMDKPRFIGFIGDSDMNFRIRLIGRDGEM